MFLFKNFIVFSHQVSLLNLQIREVLSLPQFNEASAHLEESLKDVTPPFLPHKPRGHSSASSSVDADAYKAPRIPVFSPCGLQLQCPLPPCPSHATWSLLSSPSPSRRNDSYWWTGKPPALSTSHDAPDPAAAVGELLQGGDSLDYYVANWGSKE